jgi:tRNA(Arg) A34 adenosine deaminase TadA
MGDFDEACMRQAIDASRAALRAGNMPYGAVLMRHGRVLLSAGNEQVTSGDCTAHAETVLVRRARERLGADSTLGATVYASGEPCAMCCGAMFWAGVRRVVYAASQASIARIMGGHLLPIEARAVVAASVPAMAVDGPLLEDLAVVVLEEAAAERRRSA